ncbi:MAG: DMT family transporter [Kiloniellales bacterium]|nr:DMT family transporter [Kiloniellales bacterium]
MTGQAASAQAGKGAGREVETGILFMVVGMLLVPGIDAIAKVLSASVPAGQVAWARFFFQTLYLAPFALMAGPIALNRWLWIHVLRGLLLALATLFFFWSVKYLPLADAISIFFVSPLILTLLAALFLGETIGWRRLSAVLVGFAGALLIVQPSYAVFGWASVLPLGAALTFATYLVLTRRLARVERATTMQFYAGAFGCLALSLALWAGAEADIPVIDPIWPTAWEWGLMAGLGVIGTGAHILVVHAFRRAPPSVLAPFQYLEIISATLLGLLIFGDFPSPTTWLGIAIIVASGLYVFYRERKTARRSA